MISQTQNPSTQTLPLTGAFSDSSPTGAINVRNVRGGYVKVPIAFDQISTFVPSGTVGKNWGNSSSRKNKDGSNTSLYFQVNQGPIQGGRLNMPFLGRVFGVRFLWDTLGIKSGAVGVAIDGVAYPSLFPNWADAVTGAIDAFNNEEEVTAMVATDLPDGLHWLELTFPSSPNQFQAWDIAGWVMEDRAEHRAIVEPVAFIETGGTVPTTDTQPTFGSNDDQAMAVRCLYYSNPTAAAITITLKQAGTAIWVQSIGAGQTATFDPQVWFSPDNSFGGGFTHAASSSGAQYAFEGRTW